MVPGMIDKDYFKRQARTLRKMVKVAQDRTVAERLSDMASDFDKRARDDRATLLDRHCDQPPGTDEQGGRG
jgi:hypothetical protein